MAKTPTPKKKPAKAVKVMKTPVWAGRNEAYVDPSKNQELYKKKQTRRVISHVHHANMPEEKKARQRELKWLRDQRKWEEKHGLDKKLEVVMEKVNPEKSKMVMVRPTTTSAKNKKVLNFMFWLDKY
jgi:hypothetical protein